MPFFKFYIIVLIFGKVASYTGPIEDHDACKNQAQARYEQILDAAHQKGITSVNIEGKTATEKDLAVICKAMLKQPAIAIDLSKVQQ